MVFVLARTMRQIEVFSPAKINLFLAVVGKRNDGFHDITSLVAPLDFGDTVRVSKKESGSGIQLSCNYPDLAVDSTNLAYKAAQFFLDHFQIDESIEIHLEKRIPMGAGLGGGSSNAVAVLLAMSRFFRLGKPEELAVLAAKIGSDCSLFLQPKPSLIRGRGERVETVSQEAANRLKDLVICLFKPSFSISTEWAYRQLAQASSYSDSDWAEARLSAWQRGGIDFRSLLHNDFEKALFPKYPALEILLNDLHQALGLAGLISGSGSCCFTICEQAQVEAVEAMVRDCWGSVAFFGTTRVTCSAPDKTVTS